VPPKKRTLKAIPSKTVASRHVQASAPRATAAQQVIRAQQLVVMVASGDTITEAADKLGIHRPMASRLFNGELARMVEENAGLRESLVQSQLTSLRLLKKAHMPAALALDYQSSRIILGVIDRESDLLGLHEGIKVQISNQRIEATVTGITDLLESSDANLPRLLEADLFVVDERKGDAG
jgi:hypothetical protein